MNHQKNGNYAVPIQQVKEIKTVGTITKIPKSKSFVKGVMNLRGKIIPVIDVNSKIGISNNTNANHTKQRILVADSKNVLTGLLVDEVNEVLRLNKKDIETAPLEAFNDTKYIKGIAKVNEKLYVILDIPEFIGENENKDPVSQSKETDNISSEEIKNIEKDEILPEIEEIINQKING
ncbi:chemotaxis protein CheW [Nitrosopumilus adriaticus]|uniref:Chemotaxis protein CheW n=1 Tax=Nitrosopumilus adriaticus TaxID=1580092 RepID=A0A0D5C2E3_9ARCH|nr:chemotaxis protein CheW [Nitrosopumilus adriaticus]AJW70500.1 chemotaxis protein CheW [Nitrosopumilus adriaticus]